MLINLTQTKDVLNLVALRTFLNLNLHHMAILLLAYPNIINGITNDMLGYIFLVSSSYMAKGLKNQPEALLV